MTDPGSAHNEIEAMARHEEAIANLYLEYAELFPERREFWLDMSGEESGHAELLWELKRKVSEGGIEINEGRFRVKAIETSIEYINGYAYQARHEEMTELRAVSLANDIENALIDRKFLEVFETDDEEIRRTLNFLIEATEEHRLRIRELLLEIGQG